MRRFLLLALLLLASTAHAVPKTWVASEVIHADDLNANFAYLEGLISTGSSDIPSGIIVAWSGSVSSIPSGWALCDGTNGTPDLRSRFILGAGGAYSYGNYGGSTTVNVSATATTQVRVYTDYPDYLASVSYGTDIAVGIATHTHETLSLATTTVTAQATGYLPPYYALCYIMKL